jgi:hypothetical protein
LNLLVSSRAKELSPHNTGKKGERGDQSCYHVNLTTLHVFFFSGPDSTPPQYWHITNDKSFSRSGAHRDSLMIAAEMGGLSGASGAADEMEIKIDKVTQESNHLV